MRQPSMKARARLRFEDLQSVDVPQQFLKIDEALDLLGESLRPDDWGRSPKFTSLPISYETGTYYWYDFEETDGRWHLSRRAVDVAKADHGAIFSLRLRFDQVCRRFVEGCEANQFSVALLDKFAGIIDFPQTTAVTTQKTTIFQTGYAYAPNDQTKPLVVVVNRAEFETWLAKNTSAEEKSAVGTASPAAIKKAIDAVTRLAQEHKIKLGNDWLWEVFNTAAPKRVSQNQFNIHWRAIPVQDKGSHRPDRLMSERREALKGEAVRVVRDALAPVADSGKGAP